MPQDLLNQVIHGDALEKLSLVQDDSVDIVLTDPPYFLDKLDNNWDPSVTQKTTKQQRVQSLPGGMKFDRKQSIRFYNWYLDVSKEIYRVLKPKGFFFSFSSPRLFARLCVAVEDAGFEMRDCFIWLYTQNQPKAMAMDSFINKMDISTNSKNSLKKKFYGWKTPQLKSCYEPIAVAQKPGEKTFLEHMILNKVGLFNTKVLVGNNMFPANVLTIEEINGVIDNYFLIKKPRKDKCNKHQTVKPVKICEHLIQLSAYSEKCIVLDPFAGSGTTLVACKNLGVNFIGIEINKEYVDLCLKRLDNVEKSIDFN